MSVTCITYHSAKPTVFQNVQIRTHTLCVSDVAICNPAAFDQCLSHNCLRIFHVVYTQLQKVVILCLKAMRSELRITVSHRTYCKGAKGFFDLRYIDNSVCKRLEHGLNGKP